MNEVIPNIPVKPISQRDRRWANLPLGFSQATIGEYGCAITSVAMLMNALRGDDALDPMRVDAMLRVAGAYGGPWRNYVVWPALPRCFPDLKYMGRAYCRETPATRQDIEMIDLRLSEGLPVIIEVDISRAAGYQQHFVLVVGRGHDGYQIADPWEWQDNPYWEHRPAPLCPRYGMRAEHAICGVLAFDRVRAG